MNTHKDKVRIKKRFVLTLQFYDTKHDGQCMYIETKKGNLKYADMYLHGLQLFDDKLLDEQDKFAFKEFCLAYLEKYESKKR